MSITSKTVREETRIRGPPDLPNATTSLEEAPTHRIVLTDRREAEEGSRTAVTTPEGIWNAPSARIQDSRGQYQSAITRTSHRATTPPSTIINRMVPPRQKTISGSLTRLWCILVLTWNVDDSTLPKWIAQD